MTAGITYDWRGDFANAAVTALHAEGFGDCSGDANWRARVQQHSLGGVCARRNGELVGFVNVAWDGGAHAFILDTVVAAAMRHRGIGTGLLATAAGHARAAGCEWLHVDFEDRLADFYIRACGLLPTRAGLIAFAGRSASSATE